MAKEELTEGHGGRGDGLLRGRDQGYNFRIG